MQISEFLRTLTVEEEDRVLTRKMSAGGLHFGCLLGVAADCRSRSIVGACEEYTAWADRRGISEQEAASLIVHVGVEFDTLCRDRGEDHAGAAMREEVLGNRLQRSLAPVSGEPSVAEFSSVLGAP